MPTIGWDSQPIQQPSEDQFSPEQRRKLEEYFQAERQKWQATQPKPSPVQAAIQNAPPQRTAFPEPATPKGVSGFQDWAQSQFGRQATPQELQQIATQVGITDANNITPQQMQAAQKAASEMAKQMGAKTPAPELPTFAPPPTKATPPPAPKPAPAPTPKPAPPPPPPARRPAPPPPSRRIVGRR
jgi:hypothetical protein